MEDKTLEIKVRVGSNVSNVTWTFSPNVNELEQIAIFELVKRNIDRAIDAKLSPPKNN
ncbi:MAG: hypothetical protein HY738_10040 [Bacteroidia bacterium]|nr:hypothetical protein [Bacteroidia bacterium]